MDRTGSGGRRRRTPAIARLAEILWRYHRREDTPRPVDAIVGLGSYELRVADFCAELYRRGIAPTVIFSGGAGNWTAGRLAEPEAVLFAARARALGVPATAIVAETASTNLGENLRLTAALARSHGVALRSAALVSKPNTLRRVYATAAVAWPAVETITLSPGWHWTEQGGPGIDSDGVIDEMVGDLQRLLVYPSLGFQQSETVPPAVRDAYRRLIRAGYDRHLLSGQPLEP